MKKVHILIRASIDDDGKLLLPFSRLDCDFALPAEPIKYLPENLHIGGSLDIRSADLAELPRGLHVDGDLFICGTDIATLPDDLVVKGNLHLWDTGISAIPRSAKIDGEVIGIAEEDEP